MEYYVYLLINPTDHSIFYVGQGKEDRMKQHRTIAKNPESSSFATNTKLYRKIHKILKNHNDLVYDIVEDNMQEVEALALEAAMIDYLGIENLCNICAFGNQGKIWNAVEKDKARKRTLENGSIVRSNDTRAQAKGYNTYADYKETMNRKAELFGCINKLNANLKTKATKENLLKEFTSSTQSVINRIQNNVARGLVSVVVNKRIFIRSCPNCSKNIKHTTLGALKFALKAQNYCKSCAFGQNPASTPACTPA